MHIHFVQITPQYELRALPCGNCQYPVTVNCLGGHELSDVPCYRAIEYPCGRICGRTLACGNHKCSLSCHKVLDAVSQQVGYDQYKRFICYYVLKSLLRK